jgi:hypothetical protein
MYVQLLDADGRGRTAFLIMHVHFEHLERNDNDNDMIWDRGLRRGIGRTQEGVSDYVDDAKFYWKTTSVAVLDTLKPASEALETDVVLVKRQNPDWTIDPRVNQVPMCNFLTKRERNKALLSS